VDQEEGNGAHQDHRQGEVEDQESGQVGERVVEHGGNQSSGCGARDGPPGNTNRNTGHAAGCNMSDGSGQPHPEHLRQEQERRRRPHRRGDRIDAGSHGPAQEAEHGAEDHARHGRDHRHDLDVRQPREQVAAADGRAGEKAQQHGLPDRRGRTGRVVGFHHSGIIGNGGGTGNAALRRGAPATGRPGGAVSAGRGRDQTSTGSRLDLD
jgi:hypothetical protein